MRRSMWGARTSTVSTAIACITARRVLLVEGLLATSAQCFVVSFVVYAAKSLRSGALGCRSECHWAMVTSFLTFFCCRSARVRGGPPAP